MSTKRQRRAKKNARRYWRAVRKAFIHRAGRHDKSPDLRGTFPTLVEMIYDPTERWRVRWSPRWQHQPLMPAELLPAFFDAQAVVMRRHPTAEQWRKALRP